MPYKPHVDAPIHQWFLFYCLSLTALLIGSRPIIWQRVNDANEQESHVYINQMWSMLLQSSDVQLTFATGVILAAIILTILSLPRRTLPGLKKWAGIGKDRWLSISWWRNLWRKLVVYFIIILMGAIVTSGTFVAYKALDIEDPLTFTEYLTYVYATGYHLFVGRSGLGLLYMVGHATLCATVFGALLFAVIRREKASTETKQVTG